VYQALGQLRAFLHGDSQLPLAHEQAVLEAMWRAIKSEPGEHATQTSVKQ
jgi:hypothetical protein